MCVYLLVSALTDDLFDVRTQTLSVLDGLWGKNTDKEGTMREGRQRSGVFISNEIGL